MAERATLSSPKPHREAVNLGHSLEDRGLVAPSSVDALKEAIVRFVINAPDAPAFSSVNGTYDSSSKVDEKRCPRLA